MTRRIIQCFIDREGAYCALANDGTTWFWSDRDRSWQPLFGALPQPDEGADEEESPAAQMEDPWPPLGARRIWATQTGEAFEPVPSAAACLAVAAAGWHLIDAWSQEGAREVWEGRDNHPVERETFKVAGQTFTYLFDGIPF